MRFMMLVKANRDSEAGVLPSKEIIAAMGKFNEEMIAAGVLWAARAPFGDGEDLEVRQVFEASDFPPEILSLEDAAHEQSWRDEQQRKAARP